VVAAVAPILAAAVPGKRVPQVVLLIFLGILIGPHGLGLASPPSTARLRAVIRQGRQATAQTTLRWAIVLLLVLLVGAARFGLDVVLGAMLAGMVLRTWTRRMGVDVEPLETKLEAVGYGIFIPIFFVASGMTLDIHAIISAPLRVVLFLLLLLLVRGLPSLLVYARVLPLLQRLEMTFITATTMPLLIALAEIGLKDGTMLRVNAAALVGAGVLSVLLYPSAAAALRRYGQRRGGPEALAAGQDPEPTG
jgi:Kef-type K+ transport system membrane component KefB